MMTACEAQARASSSTARAYDTVSPPLPPYASGTAMPIRPSSAMRSTVSRGKRASRSMASAIGRTSFSAKSRVRSRIIVCSSVRSSSTPCFLSFLQQLLEFFGQERGDLEEGADDGVGGDLEDRRLGILVDRADHLRRAHAGQVLDGARDAEAQVELGRDRAAGLADLEAMRPPARVHRGARGADRRAHHLGKLLEDDEVLRAL